jgi:Protein of unknown function (DUF2827)
MTTPFPLIKDDTGGRIFQPIPIPMPNTIAPPSAAKKRLFLTTVRIPDEQIWANGLFQNIYLVYRMFEAAGYEPYLMVDSMDNNKDAKIHEGFRMLDFKSYITAPFPVVAYLEFGMSCDPAIRKFFRSIGAKVTKTYLGNILNIDVETITFYKNTNFSHHVAGELDEIWTSPHYDFHAEYAGSINGICGQIRLAPYVWDPHFIKELVGTYKHTDAEARKFVIMEPNISFQKCGLVPIMAMEAYYRRHPSRVDHVVVVNGAKLKDNPYFQKSVLPNLSIFRDGKLQLMPRAHIVNFARVYNEAIVLQHQVNNEYNYSFFEWNYMGFPVVHNIRRFKDYGYYYAENDFEAAADRIEEIVKNWRSQQEGVQAQFKQLMWRFSIHNPENIRMWLELIGVPQTTAA